MPVGVGGRWRTLSHTPSLTAAVFTLQMFKDRPTWTEINRNSNGGLCTNFRATMSFEQHNRSRSVPLPCSLLPACLLSLSLSLSSSPSPLSPLPSPLSPSSRANLVASSWMTLFRIKTDKLKVWTTRSPVGVWLNRNSFIYDPLRDGNPPCQLFGDASTIAVYACEL